MSFGRKLKVRMAFDPEPSNVRPAADTPSLNRKNAPMGAFFHASRTCGLGARGANRGADVPGGHVLHLSLGLTGSTQNLVGL